VDEDELFAQAMGAVKPIQTSDKLPPQRISKKVVLLPTDRPRGSLPMQGYSTLAPVLTDDPWTLCADGVSREKLKRLASGTPQPGLTFDLHGLHRDEALDLLEEGFRQALHNHIRALCIVHGKGLHSQGKPVLKEAVYRWLKEGVMARLVLAAIPQPASGGGACLVLLRRKQ